jgi:hypothetical protein
LLLISLLPHGDRKAIEKANQNDQVQRVVRHANTLLRDLEEIRRQADLRGLKRLSKMVVAAQEELNKKVELLAPETPIPPPEQKPESSAEKGGETEKSVEDGLEEKPQGIPPQGVGERTGMRLSNVATYQPTGKFDSYPEQTYTEVFAEIDGVVLESQMTSGELKNLAEHLETTASEVGDFGFQLSDRAKFGEAQRRGPGGGKRPDTAIEDEQAAGQYRAFGEFLRRYAAHVGDEALGKAKLELSDEKNTGGETIQIPAPPPKDAKFSIQRVSDERPNLPLLQTSEATAKDVALKMGMDSASGSKPGGKGSGTEVGGSGAGMGASEKSGEPVGVLPRAEGGSYLPLEGKLADGPSLVQLIHDRGRHNIETTRAGRAGTVTFTEVFSEYARGAEAEINGEAVPPQMRDYILDYFRSIRPLSEKQPSR